MAEEESTFADTNCTQVMLLVLKAQAGFRDALMSDVSLDLALLGIVLHAKDETATC